MKFKLPLIACTIANAIYLLTARIFHLRAVYGICDREPQIEYCDCSYAWTWATDLKVRFSEKKLVSEENVLGRIGPAVKSAENSV